MANTYKNIVITPNISNTSEPRIQFSGGNTTANTDINLYVYPTSNGTLSFEGSAGQLFSITNDLANLIFSVSDVSGIPSLEVYANSLVSVAPFGGNVVFGNTSELILSPGTGFYANGGLGTAGQVLSSNGTSVYWAAAASGGVTQVNTGNGMTGGPITTTGTVSVVAGTDGGLVSNSTGVFVTAGSGLVTNSTGLHVGTGNGTAVDADSIRVLAGNSQLISNSTGIWLDQTQVNHNSLTNYVADQHVAHSTITLTAGAGLTGGGTIAANRTFDVGAGNGMAVDADSIRVVAGTDGGLVSNSTGVFITAGSGLVTNSTGLHVGTGNGTAVDADSIRVVAGTGGGLVSNATGVFALQGTGTVVNATGIHLPATGPGAGSYSSGISALTLDAQGRVTAVTGSAGYVTSSGVTSVASGNGLTGGPITATGTLSVVAGTSGGLVSNSTGVFVTAGTGTVVNATGVHVNATYIGTIAPTLTGTGASGTWGINITGSAASATGSAATFTSTTQNSQFNSLGVGTAASATAGEIRATNNITAYYSDKRLKANIQPILNALDKIKKISGVTFQSNEEAAKYGYTDKKTQVGVIAQEIEAVLPEVVVPAPFDIAQRDDRTEYSKSGENYKTVQYEKLVPLLIEAIKELSGQVEELKKKVENKNG